MTRGLLILSTFSIPLTIAAFFFSPESPPELMKASRHCTKLLRFSSGIGSRRTESSSSSHSFSSLFLVSAIFNDSTLLGSGCTRDLRASNRCFSFCSLVCSSSMTVMMASKGAPVVSCQNGRLDLSYVQVVVSRHDERKSRCNLASTYVALHEIGRRMWNEMDESPEKGVRGMETGRVNAEDDGTEASCNNCQYCILCSMVPIGWSMTCGELASASLNSQTGAEELRHQYAMNPEVSSSMSKDVGCNGFEG